MPNHLQFFYAIDNFWTQFLIMHIHKQFAILSSVAIFAPTAVSSRCRFGDPCWPDDISWQDFNATVGGRLIHSLPSAAVCHKGQFYNKEACDYARQNWDNSLWRTNQSGAYAALVWEMGKYGQCYLDDVDKPCDQGRGMCSFNNVIWKRHLLRRRKVPYYSVNAQNVQDIQASVKFARERNLYLVVKNTGHDQ